MIRDLTPQPIERSSAYLAWVRSLPCANCGAVGCSHAHHRIGHGRLATVKVSDMEAMPLCGRCHGELHNQGWRAWELGNRSQHRMIVETLLLALAMGVLALDDAAAMELAA